MNISNTISMMKPLGRSHKKNDSSNSQQTGMVPPSLKRRVDRSQISRPTPIHTNIRMNTTESSLSSGSSRSTVSSSSPRNTLERLKKKGSAFFSSKSANNNNASPKVISRPFDARGGRYIESPISNDSGRSPASLSARHDRSRVAALQNFPETTNASPYGSHSNGVSSVSDLTRRTHAPEQNRLSASSSVPNLRQRFIGNKKLDFSPTVSSPLANPEMTMQQRNSAVTDTEEGTLHIGHRYSTDFRDFSLQRSPVGEMIMQPEVAPSPIVDISEFPFHIDDDASTIGGESVSNASEANMPIRESILREMDDEEETSLHHATAMPINEVVNRDFEEPVVGEALAKPANSRWVATSGVPL